MRLSEELGENLARTIGTGCYEGVKTYTILLLQVTVCDREESDSLGSYLMYKPSVTQSS